MKFGSVDDPSKIDFTIPPDHPDSKKALKRGSGKSKEFEVYVGCAKWNKKDLKGFFPKGVKDELAYYASQFDCIELNATFYRLFPPETFEAWRASTPESFRFFPKLEQSISHFKRLNDVKEVVERNIAHMSRLGDKLKSPFLQLHDNFGPKHFDRVVEFVQNWTYETPLAIEFRHTAWHNDPETSEKLHALLKTHRVVNILVDAAGRRDLMHMRWTAPTAFVRWVGANDPDSDRARLEAWIPRIVAWKKGGLKSLYFFIHQNVEEESPALAAFFIERLNPALGLSLPIPRILRQS